ncbi:MAG: hypothetical protein JOZ69_19365 [Myxococcales bacterium]|nr:hypothetical protein [Myxococcales bacterium]
MSKASDSHPASGALADPWVHPGGAADRVAAAEGPAPVAEGFVVASHAVLFERDDLVRCDACGEAIGPDDVDDAYALPGAGVYLRSRGGDVEREKAPLCASCASAIGVAALARWEIEEEEG